MGNEYNNVFVFYGTEENIKQLRKFISSNKKKIWKIRQDSSFYKICFMTDDFMIADKDICEFTKKYDLYIKYYCYEIGCSIFFKKEYVRGEIVSSYKTERMEFMYKNADVLNLRDEVECQINYVLELCDKYDCPPNKLLKKMDKKTLGFQPYEDGLFWFFDEEYVFSKASKYYTKVLY